MRPFVTLVWTLFRTGDSEASEALEAFQSELQVFVSDDLFRSFVDVTVTSQIDLRADQ